MRAEVCGANFLVVQQIATFALMRDPACLQHVGEVGHRKSLVGHLLHKKDSQTSLPKSPDRPEDVLDDDRCKPERGFIKKQECWLKENVIFSAMQKSVLHIL